MIAHLSCNKEETLRRWRLRAIVILTVLSWISEGSFEKIVNSFAAIGIIIPCVCSPHVLTSCKSLLILASRVVRTLQFIISVARVAIVEVGQLSRGVAFTRTFYKMQMREWNMDVK
jgi:hypothetical protein